MSVPDTGTPDWLAGDLTNIAFCWWIERCDGVAIGLTSHDRDLVIDQRLYRAAPGMVPSAITRGDAAGGGGMEVSGALGGDSITEDALVAGRWDGAMVKVLAADWVSGAHLMLGGGSFGAVELTAGGFSAELRGALAILDAPVSERTSPDCRAALGDMRCRVAMAGRRQFARVVAAEGRVLTLDVREATSNAYAEGRLLWFGGGNSGLEDAVLASSGATVTLRREPRFDPVGARVRIEQGCDKRLETCVGRFANAVNFQGEPYLPGIDLLTRYPGG